MIGWYGIPGRKNPRWCVTHIVRDGKPICGTRQHKDAEFQFCATENYRTMGMIECKKCRQGLERER